MVYLNLWVFSSKEHYEVRMGDTEMNSEDRLPHWYFCRKWVYSWIFRFLLFNQHMGVSKFYYIRICIIQWWNTTEKLSCMLLLQISFINCFLVFNKIIAFLFEQCFLFSFSLSLSPALPPPFLDDFGQWYNINHLAFIWLFLCYFLICFLSRNEI